jgi:DNA-binding TFAR19-related protein (PDSD5 family)
MSEQINIESLSPAQLEVLQAQLAKKQAAAQKEKEKAKTAYEKQRDKTIRQVVDKARIIQNNLANFKSLIAREMEQQNVALTEYGEIRSNSKGGFSITSSCGTMRVTRTRDTEPFWDERGSKAVAMLKDFLEETAKKRDKDLFEILMGFLSRNEKGDLEYAKVFMLLKHRNAFSDPRWIEGLNLLEESFQVNLRGYGYEIKVKNPEGKWENITLNFTAL